MPSRRSSRSRIIVSLLLLASTAGVVLSSKPPRLGACREIMKAKEVSGVYLVSSSYSCQNITFPCSAPAFPDTRNCENYYKCDSLTITQCPCDPGETFNIATLSCDKSGAACECPSPTVATQTAMLTDTTQTTAAATTTSVAAATTTQRSTASATSGRASAGASTSTTAAVVAASDDNAPDAGLQPTPAPVVEAQLPGGGGSSSSSSAAAVPSASPATPTSQRPGDSAKTLLSQSSADSSPSDARSETSIIIAAIVCGSAVTVAVIGTVVYLCHTSRFRTRRDAKLPGLPCGEAGGYTQPAVERHVYYEIDDRAMGSSRSFVYRAPQQQPPPLPTTQPPTHAPCVRCCQDGSSSSSCLPASAVAIGPMTTASAAKKHFPATNPHYRLGSGCSGGSAELHYGSASAFVGGGSASAFVSGSHNRESSSDCSLYSGGSSSNQSTLESCTDSGSDMRAPLNNSKPAAAAKSAYVSKQVYI